MVDAEEVAELLKANIRLDDSGDVSVVGESGSRRISNSGAPMGVEEFVGHWLSERPHHLRSAAGTGAGSRPAKFGGEPLRNHNLTDPASWRSMPREDFDRLLKEGVNVQGAGGQTFRFRDVKNPFLEARKRKFQNQGG